MKFKTFIPVNYDELINYDFPVNVNGFMLRGTNIQKYLSVFFIRGCYQTWLLAREQIFFFKKKNAQ